MPPSPPAHRLCLRLGRSECVEGAGTAAAVHGDAGPYNLLVEGDHLTAVLDWEFLHLGDPAVDLGSCASMPRNSCNGKSSCASIAPRVAFRSRATRAPRHAREFPERHHPGCHLRAQFRGRLDREFVKGANSFTGQRLIELRIAGLLQRFGAV